MRVMPVTVSSEAQPCRGCRRRSRSRRSGGPVRTRRVRPGAPRSVVRGRCQTAGTATWEQFEAEAGEPPGDFHAFRLDLREAVLARAEDDEITDLRRVVLHLIEETARHLGHLDAARELLDGRTGLGPR